MLEMRSARAAQGILDAKGRKTLSAANFYCFIPALTFTKLATAVDLHNIRQWWFLPVNVLLGISLGMLLGWLFTWVAKPLFPAKLRRHVMCAVALGAHVLRERATLLPQRLHALCASACRRACTLPGNIGNLPMVLVAGLCGNAASLLLPSQPTADAAARSAPRLLRCGPCRLSPVSRAAYAQSCCGLDAAERRVCNALLRAPHYLLPLTPACGGAPGRHRVRGLFGAHRPSLPAFLLSVWQTGEREPACGLHGYRLLLAQMWVAGLFQFSVAFNLLRPRADPLLGEVRARAVARAWLQSRHGPACAASGVNFASTSAERLRLCPTTHAVRCAG